MQREPCEESYPRRARRNCCLQARLEEGVQLIICACMPVLTPLQEAKLDPVYHDALVQQNRVYNALPHVRERAQEYRRGPVGYPIKVINDAIRSVRAHLRHLFFTHLTILYSRHFEFDVLVDDATKTARNAERRCVRNLRRLSKPICRCLADAPNSTAFWCAGPRAATPCL